MGYDRAITMFSPDGRLLQVEYAKKTVRLGNTAIGMECEDGVILVSDKRLVDELVVPGAVQKIFEVDKHLMITASGILSDARRLVDEARQVAQQNKVSYDGPIDTLLVTKELCDIKQMTTQSGGYRPFGVSLLVAGVDKNGARLYKTDPTGIYHQYRAEVIGEGEKQGKQILEDKYEPGLDTDKGFQLAFDILKEVVSDEVTTDRFDAAVIPTETAQIQRLSDEEISKYL